MFGREEAVCANLRSWKFDRHEDTVRAMVGAGQFEFDDFNVHFDLPALTNTSIA